MKILIVTADFYEDIAADLLAGATAVLKKAGADFDVITVPGALEIPAVIALTHEKQPYDAYVALGCVIRGETYHFEIVCNESAKGLMQLALNHRLAIGNGIITVENRAQATKRANPRELDKGGSAANAALRMLEIKQNAGVK